MLFDVNAMLNTSLVLTGIATEWQLLNGTLHIVSVSSGVAAKVLFVKKRCR